MKDQKDVFFVSDQILRQAVIDSLVNGDLNKRIRVGGTWGRPQGDSQLDWITLEPIAIISRPDTGEEFCYGTIIEVTGKDLPVGKPVLLTVYNFYGDTLSVCEKLEFPPLSYN